MGCGGEGRLAGCEIPSGVPQACCRAATLTKQPRAGSRPQDLRHCGSSQAKLSKGQTATRHGELHTRGQLAEDVAQVVIGNHLRGHAGRPCARSVRGIPTGVIRQGREEDAGGQQQRCKGVCEQSAQAHRLCEPGAAGRLTFMSVGQMASSKPSLSPSSGTWVLQQGGGGTAHPQLEAAACGGKTWHHGACARRARQAQALLHHKQPLWQAKASRAAPEPRGLRHGAHRQRRRCDAAGCGPPVPREVKEQHVPRLAGSHQVAQLGLQGGVGDRQARRHVQTGSKSLCSASPWRQHVRAQPPPVQTAVAWQHAALPGRLHLDVGAGGRGGGGVCVKHHGDVAVGKAKVLGEQLAHGQTVVDAAVELRGGGHQRRWVSFPTRCASTWRAVRQGRTRQRPCAERRLSGAAALHPPAHCCPGSCSRK